MNGLLPHNRTALRGLEAMLDMTDRAAVIQPTGTGKSYVAAALIAAHPSWDVIWCTPSRTITDGRLPCLERDIPGFRADRVTVLTYVKLMIGTRRGTPMPHADLIILDEYHHCGARHWGTGVRRLLDANPGARIVGLSATPRRYGDGARDMTDELFDGRVASRMTLSEAWARRILPVPEYVIAGYEGDALIGRVRPRVERCGTPDARRLFERLRRAVTGMAGVDAMFARRLPPDAHVIVFCTDLTRLEGARAHAREWFGPDVRDYAIHSRYGRPDGAIRAFEADSAPGRKILYCVDMLNEGVHLDGVDAIVMLRATTSPHVYLQQLGRALDATGNRTPLVFDISDNYSGLGWLLSYGNPADAVGGADADAGNPLAGMRIVDETADIRILASRLEDMLGMSMDGKIEYVIRRLGERRGDKR